MIEIDIGLLSHKLKSPLVSVKSLVFLLGRTINKKDKKSLKYLSQIEEKTDILNERINQFISFLKYENKQVEFLYQVFDIAEVFSELKEKKNIKLINQTIVADKEKIKFTIESFLKVFKRVRNIIVVKKDKKISIIVNGEIGKGILGSTKIFSDKDEEALNFYIGKRIIEMHGGKVEEMKNKVEITLPIKAASIKKP